MDCLPGLSGRLAHLQSSNILITKMKSLLAELNMRYFNSANGFYYFANTISYETGNQLLADKLYYLNKIMNACDLYHEVELPDFFTLDHPVGSVMGRARYGEGFSFSQNCTVGNNRGIYPTLGQNVQMCANSSIIGDCNIGDNVIIGANSGVKDENVPDNCIVFGYSPNLTIKQKK